VSTNQCKPRTDPHCQRSRLLVIHSWRRMRRAAQEAFTKVAVGRYHPIQTKEATLLACALTANPKNRDQHFQRATASTMLSILYDFPTLNSAQDKAIQEIDGTVNSSARAAVGTSLVEFFPWMVYIPQRSRLFSTIQRSHLTSNETTGSRSGREKL
jgi:hypothetical protein